MSVERLSDDEVVALQFDTPDAAPDLAAWCRGRVDDTPGATSPVVWVPTLEGPRAALLGHWIVRDADGHWEALPPEAFAARYRPAELDPGQ